MLRKHYIEGGTGLRSLLDTYIYLKRKKDRLDRDYIRQEAVKMGIADYEEQNRELSMKLFDGQALSETEEEMLHYILQSGAYGKLRNNIANQIREKGRLKYFLTMLTPTRRQMMQQYPVLKKAPVLYPFVWAWRLVSKFITKNHRVMVELKASLGLQQKENKRNAD